MLTGPSPETLAMKKFAPSLLFAAAAHADTMFFDISNEVSPEHPSATVTVWAQFNPDMYAFCSAAFEVLAAEPGFSDFHRLLKGPGTFDGWLSPDGSEVTGIVLGQLHFPDAGIFADTSNPIALWSATWTTADFSPRQVALETGLPSRWLLYTDSYGSADDFSQFATGGSGSITVVPAPGAAPAVVVLACLRRRRRAGIVGPQTSSTSSAS